MRPLSLEAGIPVEAYEMSVKEIDKISYESIEAELAFVQSFHDGVYAETRKYKSQKSDQWWINLVEIFDNHNLPEQLILKKHFKEMRKEWKKRHEFPKSTSVQNGNSGVSA